MFHVCRTRETNAGHAWDRSWTRVWKKRLSCKTVLRDRSGSRKGGVFLSFSCKHFAIVLQSRMLLKNVPFFGAARPLVRKQAILSRPAIQNVKMKVLSFRLPFSSAVHARQKRRNVEPYGLTKQNYKPFSLYNRRKSLTFAQINKQCARFIYDRIQD